MLQFIMYGNPSHVSSPVTAQEILREIDPTLTEEDLEGIIEEVDEDGSGTLDFDGRDSSYQDWISLLTIYFLEFMEMMTG